MILAEDSLLIREGITQLLQTRDEVELLAVCTDLPALEDAIGTHAFDVVVTDIRMPPTHMDEGIQIASSLRETHPAAGVVVLSQYAAPEYALALFEHGSAGRAYLLKERIADVEQLLTAVQEVASGGSVIDPKVIDLLLASRIAVRDSPLEALTHREREVLGEMAQGKSNAAIASALVLTERAVEKHTNAIFGKLGLTYERDVNKRVKAVLTYLAADTG